MEKVFDKAILKIESLTLRERVILCFSVIVSIFFVMDQLVFLSFNKKIDAIKVELVNSEKTKTSNETLLKNLENKIIINPNDAIKTDLAREIQEGKALDVLLEKSKAGLVPPEHMLPLLSELLGKNSRLRLISMENKKPVLIDAESGKLAKIYKHGMVLKFMGEFSQVKNYLSQLENIGEKIYFDEVKYKMQSYPNGELTLDVYTLSVNEALISG